MSVDVSQLMKDCPICGALRADFHKFTNELEAKLMKTPSVSLEACIVSYGWRPASGINLRCSRCNSSGRVLTAEGIKVKEDIFECLGMQP